MRAFGFSVLIFALIGTAQAAPSYSITLYEHKNFEGRALTFVGAMPNLKGTGLNDHFSSVRLVLGQRWLLCKNAKFKGSCIVIDRDVPDLDTLGFNDLISSLKPVE